MSGETLSIGEKGRRLCPVKHDFVDCDGICRVVWACSHGHSFPQMCSVLAECLDLVLNR
jgi:hypothetical protein